MQQQTLVAGDSLNFLTGGGAYPASAGWVLKYRLVPRTAGGTPIDITAAAEGDDHRVAVAASTTSSWGADAYTWASWVDKAGEVYTVDRGEISIKPDPRAMAAGYDGRSQARKALEQARAAFATFSETGGKTRRYRIGGREMEFNSPVEIVKVISYWQVEVNREARNDALAKGFPDPRRMFVRLNRE